MIHRVLTLTLCFLALAGPAFGSQIFFTQGGQGVRSIDSSGTNLQTLYAQTGDPRGIAVDGTTGRMYWAQNQSLTLRAADLDGSNSTTLGSSTAISHGGALDPVNGHYYYTTVHPGDAVRRIDVTGANDQLVTALVTPHENPRGIAVDTINSKLFYVTTHSGIGNLNISDLDGSNRTQPLSLPEPRSIVVDHVNQRVIWTELHSGPNGEIHSADFDGSNRAILAQGLDWPTGLGLDVGAGTLYIGGSSGNIYTMAVTGGPVSLFANVGGSGTVSSIAVLETAPVPEPSTWLLLIVGTLVLMVHLRR